MTSLELFDSHQETLCPQISINRLIDHDRLPSGSYGIFTILFFGRQKKNYFIFQTLRKTL